MNSQSFYYSAEPKFADVSKEEYVKFINNYPRPLNRDVFAACDPPSVTYNDFELADRWPYSVVARTFLYDNTPEGYFYEPEEERIYQIMENYEEVFDSRTGNKTSVRMESGKITDFERTIQWLDDIGIKNSPGISIDDNGVDIFGDHMLSYGGVYIEFDKDGKLAGFYKCD